MPRKDDKSSRKNNETNDKNLDQLQQQLDEITQDLQRSRADFENYRKQTERERTQAFNSGKAGAVKSLLPIIDTIERATKHAPDELKDHAWVKGVQGLQKQLETQLKSLGLTKIAAEPGSEFNPELHEAVQFDDGDGDTEVIAEELQTGYEYDGAVLRASMVKVTKE